MLLNEMLSIHLAIQWAIISAIYSDHHNSWEPKIVLHTYSQIVYELDHSGLVFQDKWIHHFHPGLLKGVQSGERARYLQDLLMVRGLDERNTKIDQFTCGELLASCRNSRPQQGRKERQLESQSEKERERDSWNSSRIPGRNSLECPTGKSSLPHMRADVRRLLFIALANGKRHLQLISTSGQCYKADRECGQKMWKARNREERSLGMRTTSSTSSFPTDQHTSAHRRRSVRRSSSKRAYQKVLPTLFTNGQLSPFLCAWMLFG